METARSGRTDGAHPERDLLLKISVTILVGGSTFILSNTFLKSISDSLVLSILSGGISLVIQFLMDVEVRLRQVTDAQDELPGRIGSEIESRFSELGEATRLFGKMYSIRQPLAQDLAIGTIRQVSGVLRELAAGTEVHYEGEDRDWLLMLQSQMRHTMDATSLMTTDGSGGFDGGFWSSDLGNRSLLLQRDAIQDRYVKIRRIFFLDQPDMVDNEAFKRLCRSQREAGVEVRTLPIAHIPDHLKRGVSDFILFDNSIAYEVVPGVPLPQVTRPDILRTQLSLKPEWVKSLEQRFQQFWSVATPPTEPQTRG
jgi:hypothetical protein